MSTFFCCICNYGNKYIELKNNERPTKSKNIKKVKKKI